MTQHSKQNASLTTPSTADTPVVVGVITNVHGVRGAVKVKSFTENAEDIFTFAPLFRGKEITVVLQRQGVQKSVFIATIEGITTREDAELLKGEELYIYRDQLPEIDDDSFYHSDVIGLDVETTTGDIFGTVKSIVNYGAGDLVEIHVKETNKTELFSLENDIVSVNLETGKIVLDVPTYLEGKDNA